MKKRKIVKPTRQQAEDGIRDDRTSRGLGDVYKRQMVVLATSPKVPMCGSPLGP